jgi:hypothetical protein
MAITKRRHDRDDKDVVLTELKQKIVSAIKERHNMTVTEFANSRVAKSLKIAPSSLPNYLSGSGSTSFPVLQKLCKHLEIGELKKRTKIQKEVSYSIT